MHKLVLPLVLCLGFMTPGPANVLESEPNDNIATATYLGDVRHYVPLGKGRLYNHDDIDFWKISKTDGKTAILSVAVLTEILQQSTGGVGVGPETWFSPLIFLADENGHIFFIWDPVAPQLQAPNIILFNIPMDKTQKAMYIGVGYAGPSWPGGSPSDYQISVVNSL